jgi:hypothetical protein
MGQVCPERMYAIGPTGALTGQTVAMDTSLLWGCRGERNKKNSSSWPVLGDDVVNINSSGIECHRCPHCIAAPAASGVPEMPLEPRTSHTGLKGKERPMVAEREGGVELFRASWPSQPPPFPGSQPHARRCHELTVMHIIESSLYIAPPFLVLSCP